MIRLLKWLCIAPLSLLSFFASADDGSGLSVADFDSLGSLIFSGYILAALYLVFNGIYSFKLGSNNPQEYPARSNIAKMTSGFMLLSAAYIYSTLMVTVTGSDISGAGSVLSAHANLTDSLTNYEGSNLGKFIPESTRRTLIGVIYLYGLFSFLKGIYLLGQIGAPQKGGDSPGKKAVTHMGGGIICMNIVDFSCFIGSLLGISVLCI